MLIGWKKSAFHFILGLMITFSQNFAGFVLPYCLQDPIHLGLPIIGLILAPFFWPFFFSLLRLLRHTVYFWIWSFMRLNLDMEVFLHLFISTLAGIFPVRKTCVFLFHSGHFSFIVLIMSFPVFFLVHLLVKVKYLDGSTVSVNSVEVPTVFFLASQFFPLLQSLLQLKIFSIKKKKKPHKNHQQVSVLPTSTNCWNMALTNGIPLFCFIPWYFLYFLFRSLCSVCHLARTLKVYLGWQNWNKTAAPIPQQCYF